MRREVILITVGNELLDGRVINTNLAWIGMELKKHGYSISKCYVIRDDMDEIEKAVRSALGDSEKFVITVGGLGPTWDDMTLEALAKALGRRMKLNKVVRGWIESAPSGCPNAEWRKMATLPEGAKPLRNRVGMAPGVILKDASKFVISLPGVPDEMMDLFRRDIIGFLRKHLGKRETAFADIYVEGVKEADMDRTVRKVIGEIRGIYIKTHVAANYCGKKRYLRIHLSFTGNDARKKIVKAKRMLISSLKSLGASFKVNKGYWGNLSHNRCRSGGRWRGVRRTPFPL